MTDCPMGKKPRLWNPGLESEVLDFSKDSSLSNTSSHEPKNGIKQMSSPIGAFPFGFQAAFLQNYLQYAPLFIRMQQQKSLDEFLSRRPSLPSSLPTALPFSSANTTPTPSSPKFDTLQLPSLIANRQPPVVSAPSFLEGNNNGKAALSGNLQTSLALTQPSASSTVSVSSANPIVQSVLGLPIFNENCCAICGASFRLTSDLVQHMRNNHRKSRFKRKHEDDC